MVSKSPVSRSADDEKDVLHLNTIVEWIYICNENDATYRPVDSHKAEVQSFSSCQVDTWNIYLAIYLSSTSDLSSRRRCRFWFLITDGRRTTVLADIYGCPLRNPYLAQYLPK